MSALVFARIFAVPKKTPSSALTKRRSDCPIACSLDLLGDRWTLVILRDLFRGKARYNEFLASAEGITTNILAERLDRLEKAGLVKKVAYQQNPPRYDYELTAKGADARLVVASLAVWGLKHLPKTEPGPGILEALRGV